MEPLTQDQIDSINTAVVSIYRKKGCALTVFVVRDGFLIQDIADEHRVNMIPFSNYEDMIEYLNELDNPSPAEAGQKEGPE